VAGGGGGCALQQTFKQVHDSLLQLLVSVNVVPSSLIVLTRSKAASVTGRARTVYMFPVRYKLHLGIKTKAIPVTGRGGLQMCFLRSTKIIYI
jgi:hypothetical protein